MKTLEKKANTPQREKGENRSRLKESRCLRLSDLFFSAKLSLLKNPFPAEGTSLITLLVPRRMS